ncbi:MAG TPA: hypothetical protein VFS67_30645, partial [Polyangiaceae bacterium]|nr:hypothetical protein [Polyangiaceae bacterium]
GLTRAIVFGIANGDIKLKGVKGASVGASVRASVWASVWDSVWDSVWASVGDSVRDSVGDSVWDSVYGSHDAGWLAFYAFFREVTGLTEQTEPLGGLTELAQAAGWALAHAGLCWVSERHSTLRKNERGRLHSTDGPAVAYPDGWEIYAVDGVRVPANWITDRASLTPQLALGQKNVELRRAAVELLGWHSILSQLQSREIDTDPNPQIGQLLEVDLPEAPRSRFLKVECGTRRTFALPVPPEMATAREANAWTYGLSKDELQLEART